MLKKINSRKELESLLTRKSKISNYIKFIDSLGDVNYINIIKKGSKYYSSICEGYISYNEARCLTREKIEEMKKTDFLIEPFGDGVLYEIDTYPISNSSIEYPIVDVEFLTEEDVLKDIINLENNSLLNILLKEA